MESKEAVKLALMYIQEETLDVPKYMAIAKSAGLVPDEDWINTATKAAKDVTAKLEMDLREYKASHIKESARVGT